MSINIDQVREYLSTHPVGRYAGNFESLLEVIHSVFADSGRMDNREIEEKFFRLGDILKPLSFEDEDAISSLVCNLCYEHEQRGFDCGMAVGMQLMLEINALP